MPREAMPPPITPPIAPRDVMALEPIGYACASSPLLTPSVKSGEPDLALAVTLAAALAPPGRKRCEVDPALAPDPVPLGAKSGEPDLPPPGGNACDPNSGEPNSGEPDRCACACAATPGAPMHCAAYPARTPSRTTLSLGLFGAWAAAV